MNFSVSWGGGSTLDEISKWVTIAAAALAALSAIIAAVSFAYGVRVKRAEWLQKLYQQFYEQERYREMRETLDYRPERELNRLHQRVLDGTRDATTDQLWEYLNFFEFVESLVKLKQIKPRDRDFLFDYPRKKIREDGVIRGKLKSEGFERLDESFPPMPHRRP
jgi:hypothetical protein